MNSLWKLLKNQAIKRKSLNESPKPINKYKKKITYLPEVTVLKTQIITLTQVIIIKTLKTTQLEKAKKAKKV